MRYVIIFAAYGWGMEHRAAIRAEQTPWPQLMECRHWLPELMRLGHVDPPRFHALALKGLQACGGNADDVTALRAAFKLPDIRLRLEGALRLYRDTTTDYRFDPGPSPAPEPPSGRTRGATPAAQAAQPAKRASQAGPSRFRWPRPR